MTPVSKLTTHQESVTPACGTIAGFNGGTVHGVKQLVEGERYAIGQSCER